MRPWTVEASEWFAEHHAERATSRIALSVLGPSPGCTILDLGCGPAHALEVAAARLPESRLIGVDPIPRALELARQRLGSRGLLQRIELREGDAAQIPADDGSIDLALAIDCFDYWRNADAGLAELRRVLRPTGRVAFAKDNEDANAADSGARLEAALARADFEVLRKKALSGEGVAFTLWSTSPRHGVAATRGG